MKCAEVFLLEQPGRNTAFSKRRPADANRDFADGEFEQVYQKILDEMEVLLKKGLSPQAMGEAFEEFRARHPEAEVRKFENREDSVVVGVAYPAGTDEGNVERTLRGRWEAKLLIAEAEKKLLESHNRDLKEVALAAAASAPRVQIGDQVVQDKSIRGSIIGNSQVTTGDLNKVVQSLRQSGAGGAGVADLAAALQQLSEKIGAAGELGAMEKHEAKQAVETVAVAAQAPQEEPSRKAAGKALETLTGLLGKVPDLTKLVEAATKAWEVVQKSVAG